MSCAIQSEDAPLNASLAMLIRDICAAKTCGGGQTSLEVFRPKWKNGQEEVRRTLLDYLGATILQLLMHCLKLTRCLLLGHLGVLNMQPDRYANNIEQRALFGPSIGKDLNLQRRPSVLGAAAAVAFPHLAMKSGRFLLRHVFMAREC